MAFVDFLLFIIFPASLFTLFAAIIIGLAHDALRARAKGLLQAHQFKVINVQHAERRRNGMHTFVATYHDAQMVRQVREFNVPAGFDRIFWLEEEVEANPRPFANVQLSSKEQIIDDLMTENAELRRRISQMENNTKSATAARTNLF